MDEDSVERKCPFCCEEWEIVVLIHRCMEARGTHLLEKDLTLAVLLFPDQIMCFPRFNKGQYIKLLSIIVNNTNCSLANLGSGKRCHAKVYFVECKRVATV